MTENALKQIDRKTRVFNKAGNSMENMLTAYPIASDITGAALPVATNEAVNLINVAGDVFYVGNIGAQTLLTPKGDVAGLSIGGDQTAGDGFQISPCNPHGSTNGNNHSYKFTIGSEPVGFFMECVMKARDVSGLAEMLFGFRRLDPIGAARTNLSDYAYIGGIGADVKYATRLNTGTEALVDTTADLTDNWFAKFRVEIDTEGKATVMYALSSALNILPDLDRVKFKDVFTFDTGDIVMPDIRFIHSANLAGGVWLQGFKVGYLN